MYAQLSAQYRMIGRSLYKKSGNAFIHCAIVPTRVKGLKSAIAWYEDSQDDFMEMMA